MASQTGEGMDAQTKKELLVTMERIRAFESEVQVRFADGEIPGFVHLYIGEEAIAAGVCRALTGDDYITSTHRGHGHCIARGLDPKEMMAELYGKETGYCSGKGGSMHIADTDAGMLGANGIVASGIPIAAGAGLSARMRGTDEVAVSFFGDGAISQGSFHEAMNLAGLWELPMIGVIENNQYAVKSSLEDQHPEAVVDDLSKYGEPYGFERMRVDGGDVEEVYHAASEAVERARKGGGPSLIECTVHRLEGHHEGDDQFYRDEGELERAEREDPLRTYPERLIEEGVITEGEHEGIRAELDREMEEAVEFARDSDYPDPGAAYEDLYAEPVRTGGRGSGGSAIRSSDPPGETEERTVREVVRETHREEMERDERVFVQGTDVAYRGGTFNLLEGLAEEFGEERVRNTPISEGAITGSALGAAATGMRPVAWLSYSGFLGVPMEMILNQVAKIRYMFGGKLEVPLTIRSQNAMGYRAGAQHSQALHHVFAAIPGIKVVCTSTPADTKGLLKAAIRHDDPVMVFENANCYNRSGPVPVEDYELPIGEAAVEREGEDVTVVATHEQLWNALDAAERLADDGVSVEVVSPRTLSPLDRETIVESARKTGRCIVVDETPLHMGVQSAYDINEHAFFDLDFPVQRLGVDNVPIPYSPVLEDEVVPDTNDIIGEVKRLV